MFVLSFFFTKTGIIVTFYIIWAAVQKFYSFRKLQVWCGLTNAGEFIAVKQIELNLGDMDKAEEEYEKIQEEVNILKTLRHKNIVG